MAQTGYTPILIYSSSTAAAAPTVGNLTNSTLGSELAINITDGKLFYKDNANAIQVIGWKVVPTTAGGTGLTSYSQGDLLYYNSGTTLTALAKSTTATRYLSNTGTNNNPAWAQVDLTNGVTGTLPVANGGTGTATAFTAGSVIFAGASGVYNQKNASFFWDNTNNRLGLGTAAPANTLHILDGIARITSQNANATSAYYYQTSSAFTAGSSSKYTYYTDTGTYSGGLGWFTNSGGQAGQFLNTVGTALGLDIQMGGTGVVRFQNSGGVSIGDTTDPGAGNLRLGTGNLVIGTSGKGIDFSATPGTGTSELLNDYEEGTWTPILNFGGAAGVSTYAHQNGTYTKVGNTVTVRGYLSITTKSAATGVATLTGLPFSTKSGTAQYHTGTVYMSSQSITGAPMVYINPNDTVVQLGQTNGSTGFATISNTNFSNGGDLTFQATYIANAI